MTKLTAGDSIDALQEAYEKRWECTASAMFNYMKGKTKNWKTVGDVANNTCAQLLRVHHVGKIGFPRILKVLDENEVTHTSRQGLSPRTEETWLRNASKPTQAAR